MPIPVSSTIGQVTASMSECSVGSKLLTRDTMSKKLPPYPSCEVMPCHTSVGDKMSDGFVIPMHIKNHQMVEMKKVRAACSTDVFKFPPACTVYSISAAGSS